MSRRGVTSLAVRVNSCLITPRGYPRIARHVDKSVELPRRTADRTVGCITSLTRPARPPPILLRAVADRQSVERSALNEILRAMLVVGLASAMMAFMVLVSGEAIGHTTPPATGWSTLLSSEPSACAPTD